MERVQTLALHLWRTGCAIAVRFCEADIAACGATSHSCSCFFLFFLLVLFWFFVSFFFASHSPSPPRRLQHHSTAHR